MNTQDLNDHLLELVRSEGLKQVLRGLSVACARESTISEEDDDIDHGDYPGSWTDWVKDEMLIDSIISRIVND